MRKQCHHSSPWRDLSLGSHRIGQRLHGELPLIRLQFPFILELTIPMGWIREGGAHLLDTERGAESWVFPVTPATSHQDQGCPTGILALDFNLYVWAGSSLWGRYSLITVIRIKWNKTRSGVICQVGSQQLLTYILSTFLDYCLIQPPFLRLTLWWKCLRQSYILPASALPLPPSPPHM